MTCKVLNGGAFLHVPKTGGTWVRAMLERNNVHGTPIGPEHSTWHFEKWAFCVLREPADWWLSLWRFRNDTGFEHMDGAHPLYPIDTWHETDAALWITRAIEEGQGFCGRLYAEYLRKANYVLQTCHLAHQLDLLGSRVGWPTLKLDGPRVNVSKPRILKPSAEALLPKLRSVESEAMKQWQAAGGDWATYEI